MIEEPVSLTIARTLRRPTDAQIEAFQGVPTSFVADAMGGGGALSPDIAPLGGGRDLACVAAGPAHTADNGPADALATFAALNLMCAGDIVVAAFGAHQGCAAAGDRVLGMVANSGGGGFVTDGPVRDYAGIVAAGVPVWCTGITPSSPFASGPGRVGLPVSLGGRTVENGDMIVGDRDGVVVVPFMEIDAVIERLEHIKTLEAKLDAEVAAGRKHFDHVAAMLNTNATRYVD
ncbi:MAG: RraA family protein [Pseudomonadota bacterium]